MASQQARKFILTINNPQEKGLTHEEIHRRIESLSTFVYGCISDEVGAKEQTPHTHVFICYKNAKAWQTIKNLIPEADCETCRGTVQQNRDYVFKLGKWMETEKGTTSVEGTQEEWGTMPPERMSKKPELELLFQLISNGLSNYEILNEYPEFMLNVSDIERCRQIIHQEEFKNTKRFLDVTYVFGKTGTGKTRGIMDHFGYGEVFRITDYTRHPFDTYRFEDIIVFEEFASSMKLQDMLNYLDIYPLKLPCRYSDKQACYTKVYLTSNLPLEQQYSNMQKEESEAWKAFLRRITRVVKYISPVDILLYSTVEDYFHRAKPIHFVSTEEFYQYVEKGIVPDHPQFEDWTESEK